MNSDRVVLDINSDDEEEVSCGGSKGNFDGDDHNWLTELLDEVDREKGNSDDVVVVSEAVVNPKQRLKTASLNAVADDSDAECVILDDDPDKPLVVVRKYDDNDGGCDSDELVIVSEKGQVACRDYPHPRHLCVQFPFSSTPHERHCDQCHCYVCDSLAPCVHWGAGSYSIDHCHATEKVEFWRLQRNSMRTAPLQPPDWPNDTLRACPMSTNFPGPNLVNQSRSHPPGYSEPRNRFQPNLVSQQLLSMCNGTDPRDRRHNIANGYLGPQFPRDAFKRTSSSGIAFKTKSSLPRPTYPVPLPSPTYPVLSQPTIFDQRNQTQTAEDRDFFYFDFNWISPPRENGQLSLTKKLPAEDGALISEVSLVGDPGLEAEFQYDSWIFNNQHV